MRIRYLTRRSSMKLKRSSQASSSSVVSAGFNSGALNRSSPGPRTFALTARGVLFGRAALIGELIRASSAHLRWLCFGYSAVAVALEYRNTPLAPTRKLRMNRTEIFITFNG